MARHLQHVRSNVVNNDQPKLPTSSQIEYGEIAINYAKDHETMSIKNGNNEIVTFTNDKGIKKLINEKVADVKNGDTSIVDENKVATLPTATTSGYGVVIVDNELNSSSTNTVQNGVVTNKFIVIIKNNGINYYRCNGEGEENTKNCKICIYNNENNELICNECNNNYVFKDDDNVIYLNIKNIFIYKLIYLDYKYNVNLSFI